LDHPDTSLRLGFVTDQTQTWLDDGKGRNAVERKIDVPLPKECPSCKLLRPAKVSLCPACGFKPERQSDIQCDDGELVEITAKAAKKDRLTLDKKRWLFGQFRHYAHARGYQPGWAAHSFKEFTGEFPDGLDNAPRVEPTTRLLSWIEARMIRRAMGKKRAA
jgi:DNA repair protein RadD